MEQFVSLFFPAFIALKLFDSLHSNKMPVKSLVMYYGVFVALINLVAIWLMRILAYDHAERLFENGFSLRYLTLAVASALILPFVVVMIEKAISFKIETVKPNHKKER